MLLWLQQQYKGGGKGSHQRLRKSEEVTSHGKKSKKDKLKEKQARKVCVLHVCHVNNCRVH